MNRSARRAAILLAAYFVALGLEGLWLAAGPKWFESAREWAAMHPSFTPLWLPLAFIAGLTIARAVDRGHRWAWLVAVAWMSLASASALALHRRRSCGGMVPYGASASSSAGSVFPERGLS